MTETTTPRLSHRQCGYQRTSYHSALPHPPVSQHYQFIYHKRRKIFRVQYASVHDLKPPARTVATDNGVYDVKIIR